MEKFVGAFDFPADIRQAAVFLVFGDVVRVNGHDHAAQAIAGQAAHVFLRPQPAVGANHRMNPALRRVARHGAQIAMHHRFATHEQQIADVVFDGDVNDVARFLQRHAAARFGVKFGSGKTAEIAVGIANVGDGKLEIARPAMLEHLGGKLEHAFLWPHHRPGKVWRRRGRGTGGDRTRSGFNRIVAHCQLVHFAGRKCCGQTFFLCKYCYC